VFVIRRAGWHRLLLMLSLVLGVVIMHSTVAGRSAALPVVSSAATTEPGAGDPTGHSSPAVHSLLGGPREGALDAAAMVAPTSRHGSSHDPMSALHDLLHLCLAVLTALVVLTAVVRALGAVRRLRPTPTNSAGRPAVGPRAPPSTSVRLAQLCVLRN
jgi:hypothetical protein